MKSRRRVNSDVMPFLLEQKSGQMKLIVSLLLLTPLFFVAVPRSGTIASTMIETCPANSDASYDRGKILDQLAEILNVAAPGFKNYESTGLYVADDKPQLFFVFDLTDLSNKGSSLACVDFKNLHVYHFAAHYIPFSISHILILEDGHLKVFQSINCGNSRDRLDEVVSYLALKLKNAHNKDEIINRVKDYRKYGSFFTVDDTSIRCGRV